MLRQAARTSADLPRPQMRGWRRTPLRPWARHRLKAVPGPTDQAVANGLSGRELLPVMRPASLVFERSESPPGLSSDSAFRKEIPGGAGPVGEQNIALVMTFPAAMLHRGKRPAALPGHRLPDVPGRCARARPAAGNRSLEVPPTGCRNRTQTVVFKQVLDVSDTGLTTKAQSPARHP